MGVLIKMCGEKKMVNGKKIKTYLFTTSSCPHCGEVKQYVKGNRLDCELIEADTSDAGMVLAQKYGVMLVPLFVEVYDNESFELKTFEEYKKIKK